jgi:fatty acid desaturase
MDHRAFVASLPAEIRAELTTPSDKAGLMGILRFLAWNMPYYAEHHVYPQVPFHQLPKLHKLMREYLKVTADGYMAFTKGYLERRL